MDCAAPPLARRAVRVRGQVQGVGFRPFVYRLAQDLALSGRVLNDGVGVQIEVQGAAEQLDAFVQRLEREAPRLARIDAVESRVAEPQPEESRFVIDASARAARSRTGVTPDSAPCPDCLGRDAGSGRPPLALCLHQLHELRSALHDHRRTAVRPPQHQHGALCAVPGLPARVRRPGRSSLPCAAERLSGLRPAPLTVECRRHATSAVRDPIADALACLRAGQIVAIKGLGGFQLACDARNAVAVAQLRERKSREEKPFAVMVANAASAAALADVGPAERDLLASAERPIVLLPQREATAAALAGIAPGMTTIGIMLPSTPLHVLLFHEAAGRPAGHRLARRAAAARAGDDQRQSGRRAARDRQ